MEITGKDILVLGGWGMVGSAICRKLFQHHPRCITVSSLTREQAESACRSLSAEAGEIELKPAWGNIFVRSELKDLSRDEILNNQEYRLRLASDVLEHMDGASFRQFFLYDLIAKSKPQIIIDCVNSATGLAYQDVYSAGLKVQKGLSAAREGADESELFDEVEKLLCSLYLPQLVRHVQVLYQAMKDADTKSYVKVGTSGTGGMGLNIPYTHSEDKPSRVLLSKACVGGAHSLLLFLMGRTPDAPYTKEIKPATAIAWKVIDYGEILRGGQPIKLYDCPVEQAPVISGVLDTDDSSECVSLDENLRGVYIDTGENGTFSPGEFTAITTHEQMEYITPEEIAQVVVWEIEGGASGHDIVSALDASVLSSSYRAGVMRSLALQKMHELTAAHEVEVPAFELLGPPRLSKLLYEAHLLKRVAGSLNGIMTASPDELSEKITKLISEDQGLRSRIISIGIPILMPDGRELLKGPVVKVPHDRRMNRFDVKPELIDNWSNNGWVDLRVSNMKRWRERIDELQNLARQIDDKDTSSQSLRDATFWHADKPLDEGELVGWIFIHEDKGRRMK
ncbi:MAG TPA: short-chain dehydrogenase [Bacteroidetes bacterium]|nr:short-chain dehydrogenase [Bacteroidota bacterium]